MADFRTRFGPRRRARSDLGWCPTGHPHALCSVPRTCGEGGPSNSCAGRVAALDYASAAPNSFLTLSSPRSASACESGRLGGDKFAATTRAGRDVQSPFGTRRSSSAGGSPACSVGRRTRRDALELSSSLSARRVPICVLVTPQEHHPKASLTSQQSARRVPLEAPLPLLLDQLLHASKRHTIDHELLRQTP